jgi:hypothetical protein
VRVRVRVRVVVGAGHAPESHRGRV